MTRLRRNRERYAGLIEAFEYDESQAKQGDGCPEQPESGRTTDEGFESEGDECNAWRHLDSPHHNVSRVNLELPIARICAPSPIIRLVEDEEPGLGGWINRNIDPIAIVIRLDVTPGREGTFAAQTFDDALPRRVDRDAVGCRWEKSENCFGWVGGRYGSIGEELPRHDRQWILHDRDIAGHGISSSAMRLGHVIARECFVDGNCILDIQE